MITLGSFIPLSEILINPEEDLVEGFGLSGPAPSPFTNRWDKRKDVKENIDLGIIGEDREGVWCTVHPEVIFADHPELWDIWGRWCSVTDRRLFVLGSNTWSNFEVACWICMLSASNRDEIARIKRDETEVGDG